jgi:hypothetical protein
MLTEAIYWPQGLNRTQGILFEFPKIDYNYESNLKGIHIELDNHYIDYLLKVYRVKLQQPYQSPICPSSLNLTSMGLSLRGSKLRLSRSSNQLPETSNSSQDADQHSM